MITIDYYNEIPFSKLQIGEAFRVGELQKTYIKIENCQYKDTFSANAMRLDNAKFVSINEDCIVNRVNIGIVVY
jgi:hypothetical protein